MKSLNQKGSAIIIIFALAIVVMVGAVGLLVWQSDGTTKTNEVTRSAEENNSQPEATKNNQSGSQDQETKTHVSFLLAGINEFSANNNGQLPENLNEVRSTVTLPENDYTNWASEGAITEGTPQSETFYYASGYSCDPVTNLMVEASSPRSSAIVTLLSSGKVYCAEA